MDADATDADATDTDAADADAMDAHMGADLTDDANTMDPDEMDAMMDSCTMDTDLTDTHLMDADAIDAMTDANTMDTDLMDTDMMDADAMDTDMIDATMDACTTDTDLTDSDTMDDDVMDNDEMDANATAPAVVVTRFPFGHPGTPVVGPHQTSAPNGSSSTATGDPVWSPFCSQLDWKVAHWAKTCSVTASAVTELLAIPGVGAPLLLLVAALMHGPRLLMRLDSHTELRNN